MCLVNHVVATTPQFFARCDVLTRILNTSRPTTSYYCNACKHGDLYYLPPYKYYYLIMRTAIVQSVERLDTGRTAEGSEFESQYGQEFSLLHVLPNGYWRLFPREKSGRDVKLTTHLQPVSRSRIHGFIYALPHTPSWHSA
jgi:hypothetical protein